MPPSSGVSYGRSWSPASSGSPRRRPLGSGRRSGSPSSPGIAEAGGGSRRPCSSARNSASRVPIWCTGVPVMTSTPNPVTSASTGTATHAVSPATSGADTAKPISPPAARSAGAPADGPGVPLATCTRPSAPTSSALQPITTRAVSELRSGCRSSRQASRPSSTGMASAPRPNEPRITWPSRRPRPLPRCPQVTAADSTAAARKARPRPSRRCASSRSRACLP